jgi:phosphoribosyl-ATP pyrophosphohydrolase
MKKTKKLDGIREKPIELLFDDFILDINYFDDVSLKRTIHFFTYYIDKYTSNYLSLLTSSLFVADNDDNSVLYFQKKTTIGFILVSGYYDVFMKFLDKIDVFDKTIVDDDIINNIPDKWTTELPTSELYSIVTNSVKKFIDENINDDILKVYKEYFCLNYRTMKTKNITDITCEDKKFTIKGISKKQKQKLTEEQQEEIIKKQIEEQTEKQLHYQKQEEKQIYEEIIIKLSYFIYFCFQIKNKNAMKIIINHYILNVLKSDRATEYNILLVLGNKSYSNKDLSLYNSFTNIDVNNSFRVLRYLYQYNYKKKHFSTCGETTLLNILNYCLINEDGTFNTDKILNEDIVRFYETKKMSQISEKGGKIIMTEWLDIVSNLKLSEIYNYSGDIHNNVKNVACVLNKLVYNKESCEIEDPQKFIIDTIKYISNKPIDIKIENSTENSISMIVDNIYSLFFRPGHGEMNIIVKNSRRKKIKTVELKDISDEFDIVYSFYKKILTNHTDYGDKMDYDESVSDIVITNFIPHIDKKIIQIILSTVKKLIINVHNIEFFGSKELVVNFFDKIQNVTTIDFSVNEADTEIINVMIENIPKYLTKVKEFDIYIDELNYDFVLKPLSELKNLEAISLYNIVSSYINAPNLKSFTYRGDIHDIDENINFISKYKKLEKIELNVPETFDMNNLSELVNLKSIILYCQRKFFDFEIFKKLFNLEDLSVIDSHDNSEMKNTGALKNTNLKSIYLDGFDITSYDLDIMFNLNHIEKIRFGEVNIKQDTILMIKSENIKKLLDTLNRNETIKYKIKEDDHNIIISYDGEIILKFIASKTTKMKKIFDIFTEKYGLGYKFYINHKKIKDSDTLEILGMEDEKEVVIEILDEDTPSPRKSSPRTTRKSSPRTTRKSSPRTTRKSSPSTTRKSSPRTTRKSSPSTTRTS